LRKNTLDSFLFFLFVLSKETPFMANTTDSRSNSPLPPAKTIKGSRRLAREKVMQLLAAQDMSGVHWRQNFAHIFPYDYQLHEPEATRLLSEEEVDQLEADYLIEWDDDAREFAQKLLAECEVHDEYAISIIEKFSQNWELGRLASVDRIVLKIAITELIAFNDIPPKVTINEAIEIVKKYSTDKSGMFVNGLLDSALTEMTAAGKICKTGRGLLDVNLAQAARNQSES
jgi:transcription antitermination protein NusB